MNIILSRINRFFEIHIGWFFINGNYQEDWARYLKKKYEKSNKKFLSVKKS